MEYHGQHGHATDKAEELGQPVLQPVAQVQPKRDNHKTDGVLRRSGSSSSSSSEDDGVGGRRKKGMKEKIKEKLPGGAHKDAAGQQHTPVAGEYAGTGAHGAETTGEKKGIMEKVKEKLPGGQH